MVAIVAPTICRVSTHFGLQNTQVGTNIWDLSVDGGSFVGSRDGYLVSIVTAFQDIFQTRLCPLVQKPVSYTGLEWHDLDSLDALQGEIGFNPAKPVNNGTTTTNACAPQVAILVQKKCRHTRRQRPGRTYFPGCPSGNINSDGQIASSALTVIQAAFRTFLTEVNGLTPPAIDGSVALRVVHKKSPVEFESSDVDDLLVQPYVATQRGRSFYDA